MRASRQCGGKNERQPASLPIADPGQQERENRHPAPLLNFFDQRSIHEKSIEPKAKPAVAFEAPHR